jgi:hypothetical protein
MPCFEATILVNVVSLSWQALMGVDGKVKCFAEACLTSAAGNPALTSLALSYLQIPARQEDAHFDAGLVGNAVGYAVGDTVGYAVGVPVTGTGAEVGKAVGNGVGEAELHVTCEMILMAFLSTRSSCVRVTDCVS